MVMVAAMAVGVVAPITTKTAYALDIPQPLYPDNYATTTSVSDPPLGIPSFAWSEVEGTIKYRLQVDSDIGFSVPIVLDITTSNTSYTPAAVGHLFADGEWFWRVRVDQPTPVGEWSDMMTFTKEWGSIENKPIQIAPADGDTLDFFDSPVFTWSAVMGAAKYRFQIATSPDGFGTPELTNDTPATSTQPYTRLANGEYWWRVLPLDRADRLGTSSEVRSFTMAYGRVVPEAGIDLIPDLLSPADETFPTFTPTFHWAAVEGAEHYRLEYTSEENCDFSLGISLETRQTSYTPTDTFPNDRRVCWHVRVESGYGVGDWSDTWHFEKRWILQPQLLTPTNGYQKTQNPLFSWTPVPGAAYYIIEISQRSDFLPVYESGTTANTTFAPIKTKLTGHYYWRVTPVDGGLEAGLTSAVWGFQLVSTSLTPSLVYPFYYYLPNDPVYEEHRLNQYEDRTVAYPIFIWHRVMASAPDGTLFADTYRIQVDTDPYFFTEDIVWQYDTENTSASPTPTDEFQPVVGQDYYWRVCLLNSSGNACSSDFNAGWSEVWKARFDPRYNPEDPTDTTCEEADPLIDPNPWVLCPTQGETPELLRPAHGQESVEATPLLEWWPYKESTGVLYQVQISRDEAFQTYNISETLTIPAYSPSSSLAQRSLDRTDYGTFYWRVRANVDGDWSGWSEVRRFQVASQSGWRYDRDLGQLDNRLLIGDDPPGDVITSTFDLTSLYATQSGGYLQSGNQVPGYWYFGFTTTMTTTNISYVLYLDEDHLDGSGGDSLPVDPYPPYTGLPTDTVSTIPAHMPEYVIYVDDIGNGINADDTWIFGWNDGSWGFGSRLSEIGGAIITSVLTPTQYIELQIPDEAIGMSEVTGSASVMLFSLDRATNEARDSVPSDPTVPGEANLSKFSAVSARLNLVYPPNMVDPVTGDPRTFPSVLPLFWDWPTAIYPSTPYSGASLEVYRDKDYTTFVASNSGFNQVTFLKDLIGDNIYYWRVRPTFSKSGYPIVYGAWASGWSLRRLGLTPQNLETSVTWATPTFRWNKVEGSDLEGAGVEGAITYRLQVSTSPTFGSMVINQLTPMTSYTPVTTLAQGDYYWRVQVNRNGNIVNDWSEVVSFTLNLPTPTNLTPNNEEVSYAPTLCWDPIIKLNEEAPYEPILTAWKYRVQISQEANFSLLYDEAITNNNCWTPVEGYEDGTFYWHVAMIDGNGRMGSYSPAAAFTKQYPVTNLISPISGSVPATPTFIWTPVDGAATYRFEVSLYPTYSPLYDSIETINTQFTPTKVFSEGTRFYWRVAIRDRFGNQGPFTDAIVIVDAPITGLTATNDSPTYYGNPTTLTAHITSGTNAAYQWDYGDGDSGTGRVSTHVYPDLGTYTATVTATNTISLVVATTVVTIVDAPVTGLVATNDSPTEFGSLTTLTATVSAGTNIVYTWDFGDGADGSGAVMTHTYPSPGTYTATVTASNATNSTSAETVVDILEVPISGLSAQNDGPTYLGSATVISATVITGTNISYLWDFGDGSNGSGAISSHIYPTLGSYTATVTATNERNSETATTQVTIIEQPISGLTASSDSPTHLGNPTHFTADVLTGSSVSYAWDFGDGTPGSGATPSHVYAGLGTYTAIVTATNSLGFASADTVVTVVDMPIGGLTAANDGPTEIGSMTTLTAAITAGTHVSYSWNFGDGATGSGAMATHTYAAVGVYTAVVTAINGSNTATASTIVRITDVPISGLVAQNDGPTNFGGITTLTASIVNGTGVTYSWDFGDGKTGTGLTTTHKYTTAGDFTATVTATNSAGNAAATTQVTIVPPDNYLVFLPITAK